jgi:hypothetical protein
MENKKKLNVHFMRAPRIFVHVQVELFFFHCKSQANVPLEKYDLLAQAALIILELKIVHCPATFVLRQIFEEFIIVARQRFFYRDDLRLLLVEPEDDVLGLLPKFQRFIRSQTIWVCGYAGRLVCK